jgi:RNA:NAD 2'-phosphotransferase (TPT1/KptA family)
MANNTLSKIHNRINGPQLFVECSFPTLPARAAQARSHHRTRAQVVHLTSSLRDTNLPVVKRSPYSELPGLQIKTQCRERIECRLIEAKKNLWLTEQFPMGWIKSAGRNSLRDH